MYNKVKKISHGREALVITDLGAYSLSDTLECGQAFSYTQIKSERDYREYIIPIGDVLITVGQERLGELIFYGADDEMLKNVISPYFSLDTDYGKIADAVSGGYDKPWFREAVEHAKGIAILKQDPWETLFSFIVSQNNNIPRIRKILRRLCLEYGENLAEKTGLKACPLSKHDGTPCRENCGECGVCYSFPKAKDVCECPEKLLLANPGFRYRYLCDAAMRVSSGETDLLKIEAAHSYAYSLEELKKITGVGDKVASCVALFGLGNLDAFPIDVWMKRAIDTYFDGSLDPDIFGEYAGVAQQYIFHYIRNLENK